MSRYGRGLFPHSPERAAHRLGAHLLGLSGAPRGSASLVPCPTEDQGATNTCPFHSASAAIWTAYRAAGRPLLFVPSPLEIASTTYASIRASAHPSGFLPALQDAGSQLPDVAYAMAKWGICPMGPLQGGRFSDVPDPAPDGSFPEPQVRMLEAAGSALVSGEYQINVDASAPNTVALALDAGIPVWLGTFVDTAFESLTATSIAQPPNTKDPKGGGHAMYLSGYRTNTAGAFEFRVQNSWGAWADNGGVWASTAWLLSCWTLWPMKVAT